MAMPLSERIGELMAFHQWNAPAVARIAGFKKPAAIYQWQSGATKSIGDIRVANKLAEASRADAMRRKLGAGDDARGTCLYKSYMAVWLAKGEGPKFSEHYAADERNVEFSLSPMDDGDQPKTLSSRDERETAPDGYVRLEHLSPEPSMGSGSVVDELVPIVWHIDVLEQWVRQSVGSVHPERIKVLTARGRSMMPTIKDHDLVFVDVWQRDIREPGIYVIDVHGRLLLKKALIQANGVLILRSDNEEEYPDAERYELKKAADTIHVSGRVLAWWTLRRG